MLHKTQNTILTISVLGFLLVAAPAPCFARWLSVRVTKERAKEFGIEVGSKALTTDVVTVQLEFATEGQLKNFSRLDLRISDGEKLLVTAPLRTTPLKQGRVVASFTAHRAYLHKITLQIEVPVPERPYTGTYYELRMKDFLDLEEVR